MAQAPYAMSALEVLQTYPTQHKKLLTALGAMDPENSNFITFKLDDFKTWLSHQWAFRYPLKLLERPFIILFWMREPLHQSCIYLIRDPLVPLKSTVHLPPLRILMVAAFNLMDYY